MLKVFKTNGDEPLKTKLIRYQESTRYGTGESLLKRNKTAQVKMLKYEKEQEEKVKQAELTQKLSIMLYNSYTLEQLCNIRQFQDFYKFEKKYPNITTKMLVTAVDNAMDMYSKEEALKHGEIFAENISKTFSR